jgi:hypothetical protein
MKTLMTRIQFYLIFHSESVKYDVPRIYIYMIKMTFFYLWYVKLDHHLIHKII